MVKIDKRLRDERLSQYISEGYSANEIQRKLSAEGLGMRRKVLLSYIREERGLAKRREGIEYVPTIKESKFEGLFRLSLVILDLPIRSSKNNPNYYGFRLTAFSLSRDLLLARENQLKKLLLDKANGQVGYDIREWDNYEFHIGVESPTFIPMSESETFSRNGHWYYYVEHNGQEMDSSKDTGSI